MPIHFILLSIMAVSVVASRVDDETDKIALAPVEKPLSHADGSSPSSESMIEAHVGLEDAGSDPSNLNGGVSDMDGDSKLGGDWKCYCITRANGYSEYVQDKRKSSWSTSSDCLQTKACKKKVQRQGL